MCLHLSNAELNGTVGIKDNFNSIWIAILNVQILQSLYSTTCNINLTMLNFWPHFMSTTIEGNVNPFTLWIAKAQANINGNWDLVTSMCFLNFGKYFAWEQQDIFWNGPFEMQSSTNKTNCSFSSGS